MTLTLLSFLVVSLAEDNTEPEQFFLTKKGIVRKNEVTVEDEAILLPVD